MRVDNQPYGYGRKPPELIRKFSHIGSRNLPFDKTEGLRLRIPPRRTNGVQGNGSVAQW